MAAGGSAPHARRLKPLAAQHNSCKSICRIALVAMPEVRISVVTAIWLRDSIPYKVALKPVAKNTVVSMQGTGIDNVGVDSHSPFVLTPKQIPTRVGTKEVLCVLNACPHSLDVMNLR